MFYQERLDRGFANTAWSDLYPEAAIHHLAHTHSDHCLVLLRCDNPPVTRRIRPFRFQPMWMSHPLFSKVVRDAWLDDLVLKANIEKFTKDVQIWNKEVFGNIFHRKNKVEAKLRAIQIRIALNPNEQLLEFENKLRREYFNVLQQEEEFWSIKSRYNWLIQGDRNTKFFHTLALIRRKRNRIVSFQDNQEVWFYNEGEIATLIWNGFQELFTFSAFSVPTGSWEIPTWASHMTP